MMKRTAFTMSLLALLAWNCSTEIDVNAPYKEIPIVYATLSITKPDGLTPETTHYVKINRAFQGEGNALVYAAIPDSNEYSGEQLDTARVEEWDGNNLVQVFMLRDTTVEDRLPGTFHYPDQKVYYFNATLNQDHQYRFGAVAKGVAISARTEIVNDFALSSNLSAPTSFRPNFVSSFGYQNYELKWYKDSDGRRYEAYYTFYYIEVRGGVSDTISFTRFLGSVVAEGNNGSELSVVMVGEDFYRTIGELVPEADAGLDRREFLGITFHWAVANDDFHTFLLLGAPVTGIVEDRPDFTNVTNGYGIFVSRYFERAPGNISTIVPSEEYRLLKDESLDELAFGQYTGGRGFCSPYSVSDGTPYACP
ncbi:MAG: hypothetical protein IPG74_10270 [Flavobacteriales bacterium]|nr:hypothetical protein [Flavobacteriales bacterium]